MHFGFITLTTTFQLFSIRVVQACWYWRGEFREYLILIVKPQLTFYIKLIILYEIYIIYITQYTKEAVNRPSSSTLTEQCTHNSWLIFLILDYLNTIYYFLLFDNSAPWCTICFIVLYIWLEKLQNYYITNKAKNNNTVIRFKVFIYMFKMALRIQNTKVKYK